MKRLLFIFSFLSALTINAQTDSLTVHVEGEALANLLTDEQKQSVNYLFITGTLAEEDYAFLRGKNLPKLHELNLRKADIDTIPKKAFYRKHESSLGKYVYTIVLPEQLEFIGDSAFNDDWEILDYNIILTGKFPKIGFDILPSLKRRNFKVSEDNPYCILKDAIFSMDRKYLYFNHRLTEIPETVEIIEDKAFQGDVLIKLVFPKSLKEIKDCVFYNCSILVPTDGLGYSWGEFVFQTEYPPVLGQEVFGGDRNYFFYDALLTVPEGCYENYINVDEQWKVFKKDKSELSIEEINTHSLQVKKESTGWLVSCEKSIQQIELYTTSGILLKKTVLNGVKEYVIPYQSKMDLCIMRVLLSNGEEITIKL